MLLPILAAGLPLAENYQRMKAALILLVVILAILTVACFVFSYFSSKVRMSRSRRWAQNLILRLMYGTTALILLCTVLCFGRYRTVGKMMYDTGYDNSTSGSTSGGSSPPPTAIHGVKRAACCSRKRADPPARRRFPPGN